MYTELEVDEWVLDEDPLNAWLQASCGLWLPLLLLLPLSGLSSDFLLDVFSLLAFTSTVNSASLLDLEVSSEPWDHQQKKKIEHVYLTRFRVECEDFGWVITYRIRLGVQVLFQITLHASVQNAQIQNSEFSIISIKSNLASQVRQCTLRMNWKWALNAWLQPSQELLLVLLPALSRFSTVFFVFLFLCDLQSA